MLNSQLSQHSNHTRDANNACSDQQESRSFALWKKLRRGAAVVGAFSHLNSGIVKLGTSSRRIAAHTAAPPRCLIYPESRWKRGWNALIITLLVWTVVLMPFRLCFIEETTAPLFVSELVVDLIFFVDILFNFNTAFYDKCDNLVTSRKTIALTYCKSWFVIDLLGCVPFQLVESSDSDSGYNKLLRLMRLPRFYRMLKVIRLVKMVRLFRSKKAAARLLLLLKTNYSIIRLVYFLVSVLIMVHILACWWYFIGRLEEDFDSWVRVYAVDELTMGKRYLVAVYWVFTTLTSVGYGDIVPQTNAERICAVAVMFFGFGFYSFVIGNISNVITNIDQSKLLKSDRLNAFNELAKAIQLPSELLDKVKANITFQHDANHYHRFNRASFVSHLPVRLRATVSHFLHKAFIKKIMFFQNRPESVLLFVVPKLKLHQLSFKELVYLQGDPAEEVYFMNAGRVVFRATNGVAYRHYSQGSYFGDVEVIKQVTRVDTVQAASSTVELYILTHEHFFELMDKFPDVSHELLEVSQMRETRHLTARMHVLQLEPHAQNTNVFRSSQKLAFRKEQLASLRERKDTHAQVLAQFTTERSQRFRYLWKNISSGIDCQTVQGTFISNHFAKHRCIVDPEPQPPDAMQVQEEPWEGLDEQLLVTLEEPADELDLSFCSANVEPVLKRLEWVIDTLESRLIK